MIAVEDKQRDCRGWHRTRHSTIDKSTHFPAPATSSSAGNRMDILLRGMFPTRKLSVDPFSTGSTSPSRGKGDEGRGEKE